MNKIIKHIQLLFFLVCIACTFFMYSGCTTEKESIKKPNFIIIITDDLGYGDLGVYGGKNNTPNIDKMASEGILFSDFYAGSSVCSPSRAALMTGCYSQRIGLPEVLHPWSEIGIASGEQTIAEILKAEGYRTAIFGKWHLGHHPQFLPTNHGFDEFFGIPYSNDMWPNHPTKPNFFPDLPLIENEKIIKYNPDQSQFTKQFTKRTIEFIRKQQTNPFFIYLAHPMPHVPIFVSDEFDGRTGKGLYSDVILEIDWSVGQILNELEQEGLDENTFVIFISDNGPWLSYGNHAGSAGVLQEGKTTTFDGGQRIPCIMRWPGKIPPGKVCNQLASAMDILPTIIQISDAQLPEYQIDGEDIWPLISSLPNATSPHEAFYYYNVWKLEAIRCDKWKLHLPHQYFSMIEPGKNGIPGISDWEKIDLSLFDLKNDPGELIDVSSDHPEIVEKMLMYSQDARNDIGDAEKKVVKGLDFFDSRTFYRIPGKNIREPGRIIPE